jgi:hypothetical protein
MGFVTWRRRRRNLDLFSGAAKRGNMITPWIFLLLVMAITAAAAIGNVVLRRQREQALEELAKQWNMHFSSQDVFNLAPRIASRLPVPGAADVRVRDLIYGNESAGHRYIFSAHFTTGVLRSKKRQQYVVTLLEPRDRNDASIWSSLRFAPMELPLLEQYTDLKKNAE